MKLNNYLTVLLLLLFSYPLIANAQGDKDLKLHLETGYGIKLDKGDYNSFQIYLSPSYKITNIVNAGVGTGLIFMHRNIFHEKARNLTFVPVYLHANVSLNKRNTITPYAGVKLGYGFSYKKFSGPSEPSSAWNGEDIDSEIKGGAFFSSSLGILHTLSNGHDLSFSLAYDLQRSHLKMGRDNRIHEQTYNLSALAFKVGYFF